MHSFLLVGGAKTTQPAIDTLSTKLKARVMEHPFTKIADVRDLNNFVRLSFDSPVLIVCQNIHKAGEEALNAFLKNLEEPQENVFFALTASSVNKVLPTIVSRCQIIKTKNERTEEKDYKEIEDFLGMTTGEKFSFIDKIRERERAINFAENMVHFMHMRLHKNEVKYKFRESDFEAVLKTISGLNANGNVNLQLSNLVVGLSQNGK